MKWTNCFSNKRFGVDFKNRGPRTEYERDYDRLIFSSAFRRLQNKTQVFPLPKDIFVHNRLTHSLEVVSVGRSLGKIVGSELYKLPEINENEEARKFYRNHLKNVIGSACLAHDMGNPAFGHSGENAISKYFNEREDDDEFRKLFSDEQWEDLTNFEGNANALRLLTKQLNNRLEGGYRLTYSTLVSILKYPCESLAVNEKKGKHRSKFGFFNDDIDTFKKIAKEVNLIKEQDKPLVYSRHPFVYLVEAADDICYNIIDFEDAHRLGILTTKEVESNFLNLIKLNKDEDIDNIKRTLKILKKDPNEKIAYLRAKAINFLTIEASKVFIKNRDLIIKGEYKSSLIKDIKEAQPIIKKIKNTSIKKLYNHYSVVKIELAGFNIMSGLIEDFVEALLINKDDRKKRHHKILSLIPEQYRFNEKQSTYSKIMCVLDFMSGMTDLFALQLYKNIKGIEIPRI
ncbi:dGTP triphosphohydrolase [uncultured Aquimarina sp.]|uniref:dGTP triphosphohydrolase n=1 Tax=uncultured Aquimarina sp. TaxID=575652 RepID=UPI0026086397|nr:dNTP triphosphohydrolase [uncultured Aquimarina sp.]